MNMGWHERRIGEILQLEYGKPLDDLDRKPTGRFPVYGANGEKDRTDKFYHAKASIIVGRKGSAGEINLTEGKFWPLDVTYFVTFDERQHDLRFLYYLLTTLELTKLAKGVKPGINRNDVYSKVARVPSLPEQQRIVAILDKGFEGIDSAKANAEKNLQNARAIFESQLQSVFTQGGTDWVETTIGEQIRFIDYRGKTPVKTASGIRLITAKNVKMGYLQDSPMEYIAAGNYKTWMTRGIPEKGDVLFTTEAPLANVAQLDTAEKVAFAQRIIIMQSKAEALDSTFLKYLLLSQPIQHRIRTKGTGATVQGIKASLLKTIEISYPRSLAEQKRLVDTLEGLSDETQHLASIYERKLAALDSLKKSLLHRAFAGELTADKRPELIAAVA
jgi:type I restriction enzyme S subunit